MSVTLAECRAAARAIDDFMKPFDNIPCGDPRYQNARKNAPAGITVEDIVKRNAHLFDGFTPNEDFRVRAPIDRELSRVFPVLGQGTERLVFDIGSGCVLKRCIPDCRGWEFPLKKLAERIPGLFSEAVEIQTYGDYYFFEVQQKLRPIDPTHYVELIKKLYFPDDVSATPEFLYWEWGLDERNVPHVFDWA
jgi:hypothetical protein